MRDGDIPISSPKEDKIMKKNINVGDRVVVKTNDWRNGDWGKVVMIDEDGFYHVAMFGDKNDCPVFEKRELRIMH